MNPLTTQVLFAFSFGVVFVVTLIVLAIKFPHPTPFQYNIFRTTSSLAAAGVGAMIPGFLDIKVDATTGLLIRAGGALAVFIVIFFFNPAKLATSENSAEADVPPLKLPTGAPVPQDMHAAFVEVWRALSTLQSAGNALWRHVSDSTLSIFADRLREAEALVAEHALFFSDAEYQALAEVLRAANFYLGGKESLRDIRNGTLYSDRLVHLAGPGERDALVDREVRRQIQQNKRWLSRYASLLKEIRSRFHGAAVP